MARRPSVAIHWSNAAFTLTEVLVVVVVVGVLSALAIPNLSRRWEAERLNSANLQLLSWLDERRIQSMTMAASAGTLAGSCLIQVNTEAATFSSATATTTPGDPAAPPNLCQNASNLNLKTAVDRGQDLLLSANPTTLQDVVFTFRGTSTTNAEFKLSLPGHPSARCLRISSPLGLIRAGRATPATGSCVYSLPETP